MTIKTKQLIPFAIAACLAFFIWSACTYPRFSFVDLSINKTQAQNIARTYLKENYPVDPDGFICATVFSGRRSSDRYLQKSLGFKKEIGFLHQYAFELFFWKTRFFKENTEEQFFITVSAATGEVTSFTHHIEATTPRNDFGRKEAKLLALNFLKKTFGFDETRYELLTDLAKIHDNRTDYTFEWAHNDVIIPWTQNPLDDGAARLMTGITVSGNEMLSFTKNKLKIPSSFNRYITRRKNVGKNLGVIFRLSFFALLAAAVFFVIVKRNNIILQTLKRPCLVIAVTLLLAEFVMYINGFEQILYGYPTTSSFTSYFWRFFSNQFFDTFMTVLTLLMPVIAGEALHYETFPEKRNKTLLHHIRSTFFSRNISWLILIGYFAAVILLGLQSAIFYIGEKYFDVWAEYLWMTRFTSSYMPFIPIFVVALTASLGEETMFRLFGISLGKKFLKNTLLAALISSALWGFGHTAYPTFPMWFRGLEIMCLGLFLSFIYLRFGLISAIVAHYLFNAFWGTAGFILGKSAPNLFYGSLVLLAWPFIFAVYSFIINKSEDERPSVWKLSTKQKFNLQILEHYLRDHPFPDEMSRDECIQSIVEKGWDIAVVESAFEHIKLKK